ncbi:MAG TPA: SH3 domain-containing protein [Marmoricola sp.]|nr:SH3 domain-containing protein [Marmoricola sp.]
MTRGRHSLAPQKSRNRRISYLAAPLVTSAVVGIGVVASGSAPKDLDLSRYAGSDLSAAAAPAPTDRVVGISRSSDRQVVAALIDPRVTGRLWTTVDLDLRATPDENARVLGELKAITRVRVTGERSGGFAQIIQRNNGTRTVAWVTAEYLVPRKPTDPAHLGLSDAPCPDGSVENGLTAGAVHVYRSVCHAFPQITRYGGWDAHGEHSSGKALDIMTDDVQLGNAIAAFLQAHASELDIFDVIYRQRIWTTQRAGDGWRSMPDRGSPTANHMDHVHVSVY